MTRTEAWATVVIGLLFIGLFMAAVLEDYTPQKLSIVFFFPLWFVMLIVHELGHAAVARAVGWRVREIVIGMGKTLFVWRFGETKVSIKIAPLGGYVLPAPVTRYGTRLKSALIYAAGPGAEILVLLVMLAIFGFSGVFGAGDNLQIIFLKSLALVILIGAGFNLVPFRTDGAASDGLGLISAPFQSDKAIDHHLVMFDLKDIASDIERGRVEAALERAGAVLKRQPENPAVQRAFARSLAANGQTDRARTYVDDLAKASAKKDAHYREWLKLQAEIELDAQTPENLVLDLALQKALKITPGAGDLLAIRGASLVMRGQPEAGGNVLADAWRDQRHPGDDRMMLAYLTLAAHRCRHQGAATHFYDAFIASDPPTELRRKVEQSM